MLRSAFCVLGFASLALAQSPATPLAAGVSIPPETLATKYCLGCHNDKLKTAGVSLNGVFGNPSAHADILERVLRKVRTGEMPPMGLPAPDPATRSSFVTWLEGQLDKFSAAKPDPGAPPIHRLNRAEYSNAVRDLIGLDMDHSSALPPDDSGYGFDNIGGVLTVSPLLMEKYMASARRVSRLAIGTGKASATLEKYPAGRGSANQSQDDLPMTERGGVVVHRYFPFDAEYSVLVRVRGNPAPNMPPPHLDVRVDGKRVKLFDVSINAAEEAQDSRNYEVRLPIQAGMRTVTASFLSEYAKVEGGPTGGRRGNGAPAPAAQPASVEYVAIGGPFKPTGPGDTPSRKLIFVCEPGKGVTEEACAKKIVTNLAGRAYRRPVTQADLAPLMKLYAAGRSDGGNFDSGIEMALRAVLVSPDFLFRIERDAAAKPGPHRVTDLELASRLSFFLWSSIPDDELLQVAEKGKLQDKAVLAHQVQRMLADPKSKAMVENFAGQWLRLRNLSLWKPDPEKYPDFDDPLREALRRETELFFQYIVHEDRSVLDFIDANYTFVNDRLARHYGLQGVKGSYYRKVELANPDRGGILTQGSILTVTSYPTRTSPVLRGKWILESVLGSPPPPPPPEAGRFEESTVGSPKNLREQLEKHRANVACATCHVRMDPLGFALENFDAIGKFRTSEAGADIDASGSMPNGTKVSGPGDLKKVLMERKDEFVETLADRLLTYALGRGIEYYDEPAVREIRRQTAAGDYKFSALTLAIVNSLPFQMRRTPEK